jgi:hypothetical protein
MHKYPVLYRGKAKGVCSFYVTVEQKNGDFAGVSRL